MVEPVICPICTMPEPLTTADGFECATCGHEWLAELGELGIPPPDSEFQVSTSGDAFLDPWVASEPRGNFVVAWPGVDAADPQGNGVFYRGFRDALFADGFETSDTSRWSAAFP